MAANASATEPVLERWPPSCSATSSTLAPADASRAAAAAPCSNARCAAPKLVVDRRPHQCVRELEVHRRVLELTQHAGSDGFSRRVRDVERRPVQRAPQLVQRHHASEHRRHLDQRLRRPTRAGRHALSRRRTPHRGSTTAPTPPTRGSVDGQQDLGGKERVASGPLAKILRQVDRRGMSGRRQQHPDLIDPESAQRDPIDIAESARAARSAAVRSTSPSGSVSR